MDRDAAVTRIQRTLAFQTGLVTEIIDALQDTQVELEKGTTLPWFLLTEVASISTVIDEERVPVPSDFLREWEDDPLWYFNDAAGTADEDKWVPLTKSDVGFLRGDLPGSGAPKKYALDDSYFRIFPTPDEVFTLKNIYFKTDALLTSNVENLWLLHFPYLMIGQAGIKIASATRDADALSIFSAWRTEHFDAMVKETEARMHAAQRYIMGGDD